MPKLHAAPLQGLALQACPGLRLWAAWRRECRAWLHAYRARRLDAAAMRQLARCRPEVLDDIGAPPQWRARVLAQRECAARWQTSLLDAGGAWPARTASLWPRRRAA